MFLLTAVSAGSRSSASQAENVVFAESLNLVRLYELAAKLGFPLDKPEFAALVHLQHFYFQGHKRADAELLVSPPESRHRRRDYVTAMSGNSAPHTGRHLQL